MASLANIINRQVETGTMHWLNQCLERGEREVFTERAVIGGAVANAILDRNPDNRNISPTKSDHYAKDMAAGRWVENGETIIISRDGLLNDGQHRLQAVIDSNAQVPFLFVFGVHRASRTTVDQGRARGAGDYLAMDGVHYAKNASTATKFIMAYERSGGKNIALRSKMTNAELVARVKADDDIIASCAFAHQDYKQYRSLFSLTVMATCHYILSEVDANDAVDYLKQVGVGENIKRGDPAFAVRQAFMREKHERQDAIEAILHGWNAYRQGRNITVVRTRGTLPALI